ncbi:hypothetical protein CBR_g36886 [Chara braunii]|uniref:CCHC-type domain-containing protein n=1 Tax=Chara braunii TaxID=69332 RepID=A0A388LLY3_CHABU|nr:hypothetical protein CBR_g36886 [Chara braunii]|eukprot:GBG83271.1 hypothetical protein CBR_g36886 [Chara braunii]
MEREVAILRRELREIKENRESVGKEEFMREIERLHDEMELLRKEKEESQEETRQWQNEALRPGNKRGTIGMTTLEPSCRGRARLRLGQTPHETRAIRDELKELQAKIDLKRCDQAEVSLLKERRAEAEMRRMQAEGEVLKLREEMSRLSTKQTMAETPREKGTNLKKQLDEAATDVRKSRRQKMKATLGRLPRAEESAKKANDRFVFVQDEKKRLKALKKSGLEPLCQAAGIKYKTIDITAEDLAQYNADQVFGDKEDPDLNSAEGDRSGDGAASNDDSIPVDVVAMDGGGEGGSALLTPLERAAVAVAVSTVVLRCQQERALGRMKDKLRARRRRTLMEAADIGPDYVATSEAVIELCYTLGCGVIPPATPRWWIKHRTGGMWEDLRQCDDATDDYFNEKQHSAGEQQRDHQKQHSDVEQQRESAVQVGHELHGGEGSNAMSVVGHLAHDDGEGKSLVGHAARDDTRGNTTLVQKPLSAVARWIKPGDEVSPPLEMYRLGVYHFCRLPGHFIRECPFRNCPNGAEMAANIQGAMNGGTRNEVSGLLPAPASSSSSSSQMAAASGTSNAIVSYQPPQGRSVNNAGSNYGGYSNYGGGGGYRGNQGYGGQRFPKPWGGGYRERDNDDRFDKIYGLLSEQAEERECKEQEAAKLELLEAEKKKLQAEEERNTQARKEKELHEVRLGKIVRSSMKSVCESVLGKKVDIPDEDESEISKVKRELDELKAKYVGEKARCAGEKAESSLDALRREKEALQKAQSLSSEEEILKKEIEILRAQNKKNKSVDANSESSQNDEIAALRLQIQELEGVWAALQNRSNELCSLKAENSTLKKDFQDLRGEIDELKNANNKRSSEVVTEKSPPAEPDKGKQRLVPFGDAVYTPKDLDALHKAYKKARAREEIANKEVQALKEQMARMGAQLLTKQRPSARRPSVRKTTPHNLRPALSAIQIEDVGEGRRS